MGGTDAGLRREEAQGPLGETSDPPPPQTYIGPVLVSVNPYRDLQIYSRQHMERYRGVSFYEVPPHL